MVEPSRLHDLQGTDVPIPLALPTQAEVPPSAHATLTEAGPSGHPRLPTPALQSSRHPAQLSPEEPCPAAPQKNEVAVPGAGCFIYYNKAEQTGK